MNLDNKELILMNTKENYFNKFRAENLRLTKSRRAMIEILENQHLTFKQIQEALLSRGFHNVSTIYNNLDFLITNKIVVELFINNERYFDLAMDNPGHNADSHIHVMLRDSEEIFEINNKDIFTYITNHQALKNLDIEYIRIIISAQKKKK